TLSDCQSGQQETDQTRPTLSIRIDPNTLRSRKGSSKKVGRVSIIGLNVKADQGLSSRQSGLSVMAKVKNSGRRADLVFLCSSFRRCQQLRNELVSNPSNIGQALHFEALGRVGSIPVRFGFRSSANLPRLSCNRHRWIVFQRRVDGSLSFAQNWDSYVKGFGNPSSNYWMGELSRSGDKEHQFPGLDRLSEMTKTGEKNGFALTSRCRLRIEVQSFRGGRYNAEFRMFQVLGPEQQYRLRVGLQVGRSELGNWFLYHNNMRFSTFDRDHDTDKHSCSRLYGYGGWWYGGCHWVNLNGAYTTDTKITNDPTYMSFYVHEKHSWTLLTGLLLGLACCTVSADSNGQSGYMDVSSFARVGTTTFKGSKLGVFEIDGVRVAEPRVSFQSSCSAVEFSRMYMKYQLTLSICIDPNTLRSRKGSSKKVDRVSIIGLNVKADRGLFSRQSGLSVMAKVKNSGRSVDLVFLCSSFRRCQQLRNELVSNPSNIGRALQFEALGRVGSIPVRFGFRSSANLPRLSCNRHRWIVFQRRVDGSLSFAQNWDSYVKGFGNPSSNYWMGLDRLSEMTKTGEKNGYALTSRCRLRIEVQSFRGGRYNAEFRMFQVLGPEQQYRLRVGLQVGRSELGNRFLPHNNMRFSTFDRDHVTWKHSCSRKFGYGGWWFNRCHSVNLNGAYTTDTKITNHPTYMSFYVHGKHVPMRRSLMKFRCY
uniref:Fibrinogen C-terminal domain-containing protein n=1 Tax=Macrostomum lignano TaxID=282301 RepID=A0A1I8J2Q9_9PLAT